MLDKEVGLRPEEGTEDEKRDRNNNNPQLLWRHVYIVMIVVHLYIYTVILSRFTMI